MPTYLGFLRAINLGATRRFPKADIRQAIESVGFTDVETHINTGNVRFTTPMRSIARIEDALEAAFLRDRAFDVPTIVFTRPEFAGVAADAVELAAAHPDAQRHYVDLLRAEPSPTAAARIEADFSRSADIVVRGRAVHTFVRADPPTVGPSSAAIAKLLGVSTNRNANVIQSIAARWC